MKSILFTLEQLALISATAAGFTASTTWIDIQESGHPTLTDAETTPSDTAYHPVAALSSEAHQPGEPELLSLNPQASGLSGSLLPEFSGPEEDGDRTSPLLMKQGPDDLLGLIFDNGASPYHTLTFGLFSLGGFTTWSFLEWVRYRRRLQSSQSQQERDLLRQDMEGFKAQLQERLTQIEAQLSEQEAASVALSTDQKNQNEQIQKLKLVITRLEQQLVILAQETSKHRELIRMVNSLHTDIRQRQQHIAELNSKIAAQTTGEAKNIQALQALQQQLQKLVRQQWMAKRIFQNRNNLLSELNQKLDRKTQDELKTTRFLETLKQQLQEAHHQALNGCVNQEDLRASIAELKRQKDQEQMKLQAVEELIVSLQEAPDDVNPSDFEHQILTALKDSSKCQTNQWRVLRKLDISRREHQQQVIDVVVISRSCIFAIEPKFYPGRIHPELEAKTTPWTCQIAPNMSISVESDDCENPYQQVLRSTNRLVKQVTHSGITGRIGVFGIVVFPEGTDITRVAADVSGYYRITTSDKLLQVMQELEKAFIFRNSVRLNSLPPQHIEKLVCQVSTVQRSIQVA